MFKQIQEFVLDFFENKLPERTGEEPRFSQVQMAIDILGFLHSSKRCYLAHAPAGIGKSYATLVPAVVYMKDKPGRVIYATHSLNLQAQLRCEELCILKSMGLVEDYIIAKGLTNYVCRRKLMYLDDAISNKILKIVKALKEGDRVEIEAKLGVTIKNEIWDRINIKSNNQCECCGYLVECPSMEHREKFNSQGNEVIVTNHNQLVQSALNVLEEKQPIIDYFSHKNVIIIDEAHSFEDAIIRQLTHSVTVEDLKECSQYIRTQKTEFINAVKVLVEETERYVEHNSNQISQRAYEALKQIDKQLHNEMIYDMSRGKNSSKLIETVKDATGRLLSQQCHKWFDLADKAFSAIEYNYRQRTKEIINEFLNHGKLIFTSGTLAVNDSFEHLYFAWGGKPDRVQEESYQTIFDYSKQVICYIPEQKVVPLPPQNIYSSSFEHFCYQQAREIEKLIQITNGRTLVLCTSHRQVDLIYGFLCDILDIPIYKQGEGSTEYLTREFKNNIQSILIGSGAFFSGVSISKDALISVILCRLPFPAPEDPLFELMTKDLDSKKVFDNILFPQMLIRLFQSMGRLIRSRYDYGCFTVLDPRALDSSYTNKFVRELDDLGVRITRNRGDIAEFLAGKGKSFSVEYPQYSREKVLYPKQHLLKTTIWS